MPKYACAALIALAVLGGWQEANAEGCFNLAAGEPRSLTGTLEYVIFAGPPNFEDVQKGDTPEPSYVLRLPAPICISGDDFADPKKSFEAVQLVETEATSGKLHNFLHKTVVVTLTKQLAAETGHHHEPLVAWVSSIQPPGARPMDFTDEYGTAATTIRAFYDALRDGQGEVAAALIAPDQRSIPAFSPQALSNFYGNMQEPIHLIDIARGEGATFVVRYHYRTGGRTCDGTAVVNTVVKAGRNFISSIKAMSGC